MLWKNALRCGCENVQENFQQKKVSGARKLAEVSYPIIHIFSQPCRRFPPFAPAPAPPRAQAPFPGAPFHNRFLPPGFPPSDPPPFTPLAFPTPDILAPQPNTLRPPTPLCSLPTTHSGNIKQHLQLLHQHPLLLADIAAIILFQGIDTLPTQQAVQRILLVQLSTVERLVGPFDLDGDRGLALFADGDLLVVAFDGGAMRSSASK